MSRRKATAISLPLSRTAKIMTSAVGVESVNQDIVALATKATEIFLMDFARRAYDQSSDEEFRSNLLEYDDIQKLVHSDPRYDFLIDTTPKRIKFSEALRLVNEANARLEASNSNGNAEDNDRLKSETLEPDKNDNEPGQENDENRENEDDEDDDDDEDEDDEDEEETHQEELGEAGAEAEAEADDDEDDDDGEEAPLAINS